MAAIVVSPSTLAATPVPATLIGAVLVALNLLACLGFVLFLLAQHPQTY